MATTAEQVSVELELPQLQTNGSGQPLQAETPLDFQV